ncbi:MAG: flagellar basal body rod protein FlgB [Treponemataceae bacterium]|nr:flagellar basal body rod protein FlgB [Treponema sp.]MDE5613989.1 flagellar basal body rod protein FlgB [Treponemataceae bacterium]MDE5798916.1 flagellar basal body rod protein FlgB [Treponemataceae bacterium]MDE6349750.1 flagellar basal body rod protein FlgB [Treponemataceae bacterium]MDE6705196.1 flagellar basal body rod protein FlgB [Treponemataceae bacterium]
MSSFTDSVDLLHRAMNVHQLRYQVSADNIANAGTPGFKRQVVNFESELQRAFESEADKGRQVQLTRTDSRHFSLGEPYDWREVEPRRVTDWATTAEANGSNVDAEYEAMNILKLQMSYRLLTQVQSFEFSQLRTAMRK